MISRRCRITVCLCGCKMKGNSWVNFMGVIVFSPVRRIDKRFMVMTQGQGLKYLVFVDRANSRAVNYYKVTLQHEFSS